MEPHTLQLEEYRTTRLPESALPQSAGEALFDRYRSRIDIAFPTYRTGNQWELTPQGYAGHIPLSPELHCVITPKTEIANVFRMLEYAYRQDFLEQGETVRANRFDELYERLATVVAKRVIDRSRRGFYRKYQDLSDRLPFLRGRLNLAAMLVPSAEVAIDCDFQEHTSDIPENQLLAWTLRLIARSGICREETARVVRRAYRATQGVASLRHCTGNDIEAILYNRLNIDYQPLHALCRFFLDHSGPGHHVGDRGMLPFLINMNKLYESFVTEWLRRNLPDTVALESQATYRIGEDNEIAFFIDQLLVDAATGKPVCLLDTKYKVPDSPSTSDLQQVIAYAKVSGCPNAVLVYPEPPARRFQGVVDRDIRVWTATFSLAGDLDENGKMFLSTLSSFCHL